MSIIISFILTGGFPGGMPGNFPGGMPGMGGAMPGMAGMAGMPGLNEILSDPEVLAAMQVRFGRTNTIKAFLFYFGMRSAHFTIFFSLSYQLANFAVWHFLSKLRLIF